MEVSEEIKDRLQLEDCLNFLYLVM
jgi:hypothetical protein